MHFSCIIANGKPLLEYSEQNTLNQFYKINEGKTVYIHVDTVKPSRTLLQNSYYWTLINLLSDFTGDTPKDLHDNLKEEFITPLFDKYGKQVEKSTTRLTTAEFTKYIERVRQVGAEWGCILPDPLK